MVTRLKLDALQGMNPNPLAYPSARVRQARTSVAAWLHRVSGQLGAEAEDDGRYRLERLALSDLCETLMARAEGVIFEASQREEVHPSSREEFVIAHLRAALLSWLWGRTKSAPETAVVKEVFAQMGLTFPSDSIQQPDQSQ